VVTTYTTSSNTANYNSTSTQFKIYFVWFLRKDAMYSLTELNDFFL